jgi:hypothetical protein
VVSYRSGREKKMYSAPRSILAVALFFMPSLSGTVAFPQAVKLIRHAADPLPLANLPVRRAPCTKDSGSAVSAPYGSTPATGDAGSPCDTPPVNVPSVNPCNPASLAQLGCHAPRDLVQEDLETKGKPGQKILRARERVLEILQTENACSAWFREKDSNPADTFRTLSFEVDRKAEDFVLESRDADNMNIFRNPYVAKVFQGDGRYATITINTNGAFFSPMARVVEVWKGGGPVSHRGPRLTNVGPYAGDTMHAQVLVLLHEFGHVLDLLPADGNNVDGKSVQNTNEVLRFCRAEVESKAERRGLSATR